MMILDESLERKHLLREHQTGSTANLTFSVSTFPANNTKAEVQEDKYWINHVLTAVFILVIIFTTFGNLTTIIAVRVDKHLRSISNLYIASLWTAMIVFLRVSNGRPPNGKCYLLWNPPFMALIAASTTVYLPIIVILTLFVSIMVALKNMIAMEYKMRRFQSVKDTKKRNKKHGGRTRTFTSACDAGSISFNPRIITSKSDPDDTMSTCHSSKQDVSSDVDTSEEIEAYYSISIQQEKERLGRPFYRQGRLHRSVSTNTG